MGRHGRRQTRSNHWKSARAARTALGLSQADVAEKLGLSLEFVGRIERGVALPSVPTLFRWQKSWASAVMHCSVLAQNG